MLRVYTSMCVCVCVRFFVCFCVCFCVWFFRQFVKYSNRKATVQQYEWEHVDSEYYMLAHNICARLKQMFIRMSIDFLYVKKTRTRQNRFANECAQVVSAATISPRLHTGSKYITLCILPSVDFTQTHTHTHTRTHMGRKNIQHVSLSMKVEFVCSSS